MGEPATPTAKDRAETRALAARIIKSVHNDERMSLPVDVDMVLTTELDERDTQTITDFVFQLTQEIDALRRELGEAIDLAEEANGDPSSCSYNVPIGDRLKELRRSRGVR